MATTYKTGDKVAWDMLDGRTMAGVVRDGSAGLDRLEVRRVDGCMCLVPRQWVRPADAADTLAAIRFFCNLGR